MSRPTTAPATIPSTSHAATRGAGRHRVGRPSGVRCTDLPAVRARMQLDRPGITQRNPFLRWLLATAPSGRHTWNFLASSGGRPRTAFAIILSL